MAFKGNSERGRKKITGRCFPKEEERRGKKSREGQQRKWTESFPYRRMWSGMFPSLLHKVKLLPPLSVSFPCLWHERLLCLRLQWLSPAGIWTDVETSLSARGSRIDQPGSRRLRPPTQQSEFYKHAPQKHNILTSTFGLVSTENISVHFKWDKTNVKATARNRSLF